MAFVDGEILTAQALNKAFEDINQGNIIVINSTKYAASGTIYQEISHPSGAAPYFYSLETLNMPYTPPAGWRFDITAAGSNETGRANPVLLGAQWATDTNNVGVSTTCRVSSARSTIFTWRLVKA